MEVLYQADGNELAMMKAPDIPPGDQAEVVYTFWPDTDLAQNESQIEVVVDPENKIFEVKRDDNSALISFTAMTDVENAVTALQVASSIESDYIRFLEDINGDGKIGLEEAVYYLQKTSGVR